MHKIMLNEVSRELIINFQLTSASFTHKKIPFTRNNPLQREFLGVLAYLVRPKQIFIFSHTSRNYIGKLGHFPNNSRVFGLHVD